MLEKTSINEINLFIMLKIETNIIWITTPLKKAIIK